jgi:hypothetical protein
VPYSFSKQVNDAAAKWKLCGFASRSEPGSRHSLDLIDGCAVPQNRIAVCMGEMGETHFPVADGLIASCGAPST